MKKHLIILFIVSAVVRIAFALVFDTARPHYGMSYHYAELAYMIASGNGYSRLYGTERAGTTLNNLSLELGKEGKKINHSTELPFEFKKIVLEDFRPPAYPYFLAAIYRLFGEPLFLYATLIQALLGAFLPVLVFFVTRKLFGQDAAVCAAWLSALYPPLIFIQLQPLADAFQIFFIVLALFCFICGADEKFSLFWLGLGGAAIGIGYLFRVEILLLIPVFCLLLFYLFRFSMRTLKGIAAVLVCCAVFITPWVLRNHQKTGYWYLTSGAGMAAWLGIAERENKWGAVLDDEHAEGLAGAQGYDFGQGPGADRWFKKKVAAAFKEDPVYFLVSALHRVPQVIATPFFWGYENPWRTKGFYSYFRLKENLNFYQIILRNKTYILKAFWDRLLIAFISLLATISMFFIACKYRCSPEKAILFLGIPLSFMLARIGIRVVEHLMALLLPFQLISLAVLFTQIRPLFLRRELKRVLKNEGFIG